MKLSEDDVPVTAELVQCSFMDDRTGAFRIIGNVDDFTADKTAASAEEIKFKKAKQSKKSGSYLSASRSIFQRHYLNFLFFEDTVNIIQSCAGTRSSSEPVSTLTKWQFSFPGNIRILSVRLKQQAIPCPSAPIRMNESKSGSFSNT